MKIVIKIIILLVLSSLFHILYAKTQIGWLKLIAPTDESVFQHIRMIISAYALYSFGEYFFFRKKIKNKRSYTLSRFLMFVLFPWVMIMVYLLPQSLTGKMPTEGLEVLLAISATTVFWALVIPLEKELEKIKYSQSTSLVIIILFLLLLLSSTIFTFNLPVYDVFSLPVTLY